MKEYDYLIVGAGLYGAMSAFHLSSKGKKCLVVERRNHIGGNCYTENIEGINVHRHGAHIFHTSNKRVWDFVNSLVPFNDFVNSPIANYNGELYNLPFNMNTFHQMWGVDTPQQAKEIINRQRAEFSHITEPANLEQQALVLVGRDIYEKLIKGYSEKQWGMKATEIPAFVIRRLPLRFEYNNNYFNDTYQGIPIGGYTPMFDKLLAGSDVRLGVDYLSNRYELDALAQNIIYTGRLDAFFDFCEGELDFRSLEFVHQIKEDVKDFQGNAVVNYTSSEQPYTRIIEHKHFERANTPGTVITYEYPKKWEPGSEPYYPINNSRNDSLAKKYNDMAKKRSGVTFGGRLAEYKYYDMHQIIEQILEK
ncbi:MAG: UDP-galactopyranose mutase [Bacteroidaceae bacterium]|nr:UDP-galactopyranose mutase [Bacteroidaceae bacterium]